MLTSLMGQLGGAGQAPHPLLQHREAVKGVAILCMTSDRGMCGGFNGNLQKRVAMLVSAKREEGKTVVVFPLGSRMEREAKKRGYTVTDALGKIIGSGDTDSIRGITERLVDGFIGEEFDEVYLVSNRFQSALSQVPDTRQLIPVEAEEAPNETQGVSGDPYYEPNQMTLLHYVVPRYIEVQVRQAILESIAGEHAARMNAMNSATDNATEMVASLTLQMNRARQAAITKELMEIIGGAEAIK
jgi:F-type H+-transporting ATPase subunit gamma